MRTVVTAFGLRTIRLQRFEFTPGLFHFSDLFIFQVKNTIEGNELYVRWAEFPDLSVSARGRLLSLCIPVWAGKRNKPVQRRWIASTTGVIIKSYSKGLTIYRSRNQHRRRRKWTSCWIPLPHWCCRSRRHWKTKNFPKTAATTTTASFVVKSASPAVV